MSYFNLLRSQILLKGLPVLLLAISGCSLPKSENKDQSADGSRAQNFYVDNLTHEFTASEVISNTNLANKKTLSLSACVKDRRNNNPLIDQEFNITSEDFEKKLSTDRKGCLKWNHILPSSPLIQGQNIELNYAITSNNRTTGTAQLVVIANPWADQVWSSVDSDLKSIKNKLSPIKLNQAQDQNESALIKLEPDRGLFTIKSVEGNHAIYSLDFVAKLELENQNYNGEKLFYPIKKAPIKARMTLLNRQKNNTTHLIHQTQWLNFNDLDDNKLIITTSYPGNSETCPNGRIDIGIEVDLSAIDKSLKPFEMLYQGPNCQANGFIPIVKSQEFSDALKSKKISSLKDFLLTFRQVKLQKSIEQKSTSGSVYFSPLTFSFSQISGDLLNKTRFVRVGTCVSSLVDSDILRGESIKISTLSGKVQIAVTDGQGCFTWEDSVTFDYYQPECWEKNQIRFEFKNQKISQSISIAYNPVSEQNIFRDLRYFSIPEKQACHDESETSDQRTSNTNNTNNSNNKSEIFISSFSLDNIEYDYEMDPFLNLTLVKKGILSLRLFLKRPSLVSSVGNEDATVPPGEYLLRFALIDVDQKNLSKLDPMKIYTYTEKIVQVKAGSLVTDDISIKLSDFKSMGNINQLFISVVPKAYATPTGVMANAPIKMRTFRGPLLPERMSEFGSFQPIENDQIIGDIRTLYFKKIETLYKKNLKASSKNEFAQAHALRLINLEENNQQLAFRTALTNSKEPLLKGLPSLPRYEPLPASTVSAWINNKSLLQKNSHLLCNFWIDHFWKSALSSKEKSILKSEPAGLDRFLRSECVRESKKNIDKVFNVEVKAFVHNPTLKNVFNAQTRDLSLSKSISKSYSNSHTQSLSWDAKLGFKFPDIPGLDLISVSTGVGYSISESDSESTSDSENYGSGLSLLSEELRTQFSTDRIDKCLTIKLNPLVFKSENSFLGLKPSKWTQALNDELTNNEKVFYAQSGIMICEASHKHFEFTETYTVINQKLSGTTIINPNADSSRPFFASVRGKKDSAKLVNFLTSSTEINKNSDFETDPRIENRLKEKLLFGIPSYPGVYTIE